MDLKTLRRILWPTPDLPELPSAPALLTQRIDRAVDETVRASVRLAHATNEFRASIRRRQRLLGDFDA